LKLSINTAQRSTNNIQPQLSTPISSTLPKAINPYAHVLPHVHIVEIDIPCMVIGGAVEEAPGEAGFFREQISAIDLGIGGSLIDLIVFI
jgi:hypothetical protein